MNEQAARELVEKTLQGAFDENQFIKLVRNIFKSSGTGYKEYDSAKPTQLVGKYQTADQKRIDVLIIRLEKGVSLARARTKQRNLAAQHLKGAQEATAALVAFVAPDNEDWRFSFVKMEYKFVGSDKVTAKEEFTPARRYSFLVGKNESSYTAKSRLLPILRDDETKPTLADLEKVFSVEPVTKEFFKKYQGLYRRLKDALGEVFNNDAKVSREFDQKKIRRDGFAKKLLEQIVFLYFLQKKGWFGVKTGEEWGSGSKNFLRELFKRKHGQYENFFNDILEPLFYQVLGDDRRANDDHSEQFDCRIPFLNGGLFDPPGGYDWKGTHILLPNDIFSSDTDEGILDIFDRYNFTVKEDEPLEKEVAVDPEMLGKVFENLLEVKNRRSQGAYYTPREIVHYMCQESLVNYLVTELDDKVNSSEIRKLIKYDEESVIPDSLSMHAQLIDTKLATIRICEPAIGSGAFAVGMMNEIVRVRSALAGKNSEPTPYSFKRHAIQYCIYGVDDDPGAVEIAKLRLWLSLVVDEEERTIIKPLPNLDYKIVQGNSLLSVEKDMFNAELFDKLERLKPLHFDETDANKKQEYSDQIDELISLISEGHFDFKVYFSEVFHEKKGFDIVIGNPPYVKEPDNKSVFEEVRKNAWGQKWYQGKMDFWYFFLHKAMDIVKKHGSVSFITSRYWLNSTGAKKLIRRLQKELSFISLLDIGKLKVFDEVVGQHMVAVYTKNGILDDFIYKKVHNDLSDIEEQRDTPNITIRYHKNSAIFSGDQIQLDVDELTYTDVVQLGDIFNVSQGVVQNPDKISKKSAEKYNLQAGEGVFVLNESELEVLGLNVQEKFFVKPFFDEHEINRYLIRAQKKKYLLYITKENCHDITQYPNLQAHLEKYKKVMLDRRETKNGRIDWFHIHWPRKKRYFEEPKIAFPTMFAEPSASFQENVGYFGLSTNLIITKDRNYSLKFCLAILNSRFAHYWFYKHGKEKGVGVDIGVSKLREFPIKRVMPDLQNEFVNLVDKILSITQSPDYSDNKEKQKQVCYYEKQIDKLVYDLYGLNDDEIEIVEHAKR